ncbi:thiamine pyrophosphate-binding protein [Aliiglaciecola sp. 3_MG-2023]|uniref:thiamine pyrophosphate-binding protein n=1 Tax=Aliiglaciecola sp. 3_MG-2023 TaxID=3062644 RepID=UPI0026E472C5|nr:thiamine pyrophosphate-binding protein [Aliiglaciecola sp. 3_MG-2023]MDO6694638.1 thiamine pyrophosphate-binding protein [Aliiglaciecola sp. 3_MG-2023]
MSQVQQTSGGSLLADRLHATGVKTIFSLAGAGHTHLLLPLEDLGVRIVSTRHESGAVGAADGYARATGEIGVAAIIAEQGLPNAVSPISTAMHAGSPLVVLATRFPDSWVEADGEVPVDHHQMISGVCKWVRTVPSADKLIEYFDTACRIATAGRPGPVVLVIPQNFLMAPCHPSIVELPHVPNPPIVNATDIRKIADMIVAANHPVVLMDSGAVPKKGEEAKVYAALNKFNKDFDVPIFTYGQARGLIPEDNESVLPWPFGQLVLPEIDLLIVVGTRLNMWFGFGRAPRFPENMKTVQIDIEAETIHRNNQVTFGAVGDPATAIQDLALELNDRGFSAGSLRWLDGALAERKALVEERKSGNNKEIHALELIQQVEKNRPKDGIFVGDGADILNWSQALVRIARPRGYLDHHPLGSMGVCLPMALGAAAAERDIATAQNRAPKRTTLLTGDGSLGFYIAELDTIAREGLLLTIIVGNDAQWGTEVHGQRLMTKRTVSTVLDWVDYAKVAQGFGLEAHTVNTRDELNGAIEQAYTDTGPKLVNVRIDPAAGMELKINPQLTFLIFSDLAPPNR